MKNPIHVLHDSHPRIWCVTIFVPMVVITIVAVPMVFLFEIIVDIPMILSNFWSDIQGLWYRPMRYCKDIVGGVWKSLKNGWKGVRKCS